MERKIILYIAMSLDGYIADHTGGVSWLEGRDPVYDGDYGYADFFHRIDTILMGWNTYHQVTIELAPGEWPYKGKETYVLTHRQLEGREGIFFADMPASQLVRKLRSQKGGDIWLCGGAELVGQLLTEGMIDEFHLSIMPCLLGDGIRLFPTGGQKGLTLCSVREENGVLVCVYQQ